MPVPNTINDLSTTAASNSPSGAENPFPDLDNHLRSLAAFIAQLRDGKLSTSSVSAFIQTLFDDADAATARTTLGAVGLTGNETVAGVKTFSASPIVPAPTSGTDAANKAYVDALGFPGEIRAMARLTAPAGWLLIDGKTIGNAASGATSRANADTAALFAELWAFPAASTPIFDSAGAVSTRGASAAADFAANKRIALFTPDGGAFLRMWTPGQTADAGRPAGSAQSAFAGTFPVQIYYDDGDAQIAARQSIEALAIGGQTLNTSNQAVTVTVTPGDARPYNLSMPHYIKL